MYDSLTIFHRDVLQISNKNVEADVKLIAYIVLNLRLFVTIVTGSDHCQFKDLLYIYGW